MIPSCISLKITKLLWRWWWKEEVPSWDTCHELRGLLLICSSIESFLIPRFKIRYVDTKIELTDILTKGSFSEDEWNNLLRLKDIMTVCTFPRSHFTHFVSDFSKKSRSMSKRGQEQKFAEGSAVTKSKPIRTPYRSRSDQSFWCLKRPRFESLNCRKWLQYNPEQTWIVLGEQWECESQSLRQGTATELDTTDDVRHSQVNRQENVQSTETWKRDKVIFSNDSFRQRTAKSVSATAVKTEFLNMEITHHQLCLERTRIICYRGLQDQDPHLLRWRQ